MLYDQGIIWTEWVGNSLVPDTLFFSLRERNPLLLKYIICIIGLPAKYIFGLQKQQMIICRSVYLFGSYFSQFLRHVWRCSPNFELLQLWSYASFWISSKQFTLILVHALINHPVYIFFLVTTLLVSVNFLPVRFRIANFLFKGTKFWYSNNSILYLN